LCAVLLRKGCCPAWIAGKYQRQRLDDPAGQFYKGYPWSTSSKYSFLPTVSPVSRSINVGDRGRRRQTNIQKTSQKIRLLNLIIEKIGIRHYY
jgi:hypothetical protein